MFKFFSKLFSDGPALIPLASIHSQLKEEHSRTLLAEEKIEATALIAEFPPQVEHEKKKILFN